MNRSNGPKGFILFSALACVCAVVLGVGAFAVNVANLADRDPREENWEFVEVRDVKDWQQDDLSAEISIGEAESLSSHVVQGDDGSRYAPNRVLLAFDGSMDEQELCAKLQKEGVEVKSVSLVSKMLDENQVLVSVDYAGDEDPQDLADRLVQDQVVSLSEPDYVMSPDDVGDLAELMPGADAPQDGFVEEEYAAQEGQPLDSEIGSDEDVESVDDTDVEASGANSGFTVADPAMSELAVADIDASVLFQDVMMPDASVNDAHRSKQWELTAAKLWNAWDYWQSNGNVVVAVLDTGIDYDHPDLKNNLVASKFCKNTYTEVTGYAAVNDEKGHGTHVSGIIAAYAYNGIGTAGVSYNAKILPIKASHNAEGSMYNSDLIEGIDYAISLKTGGSMPGIRVINMSLGSEGSPSTSFQAAVNRAYDAGILVVSSAGNDAKYHNPANGTSHYPASYDNVMAVSALKQASNTLGYAFDSSYSNYGPYVDIAAPGTRLYSAIMGGGYGYKTGTSMATPVVSGAAALVYAQNMGLNPDQATWILQATATDMGAAGKDNQSGNGALNAYHAIYQRPIPYCTFSSISDQKWTGGAVKPKVTVKYGNTTLVEGADYTLSYSNNVNVGTASVTITGKGRSAGSTTRYFKILKRIDVVFDNGTATYDEEPHYLRVSSSLPSGVSVSYSNNGKVNAGSYTVTARFSVDSSRYLPISSKAATLTINPASILDCTYYTMPGQPYTGLQIKPKPTLLSPKGTVLTEGVDYTLAYLENVDVGEGWIRVTGKGNYTDSGYLSFDIVPSVTRVAGSYARDTSAAISQEVFQADSSEWVVIARDDDFADAMSATGLAGALGCPIVLTDRYGLSAVAAQEVERLGAAKAYVVGGRGAMPGNFESELKSLGCIVQKRVYGNEAYDTSVECAKIIASLNKMDSVSAPIIVAYGQNFQDALSMSSFAYAYRAPIFLQTYGSTSADRGLTQDAIDVIRSSYASSKVFVPGGPGAVSDASLLVIGGADVRLYGYDGYGTSIRIANYMVDNKYMNAETVVFASGAQAPKGLDALSGAALAGKEEGVMLLVNNQPDLGSVDVSVVDEFLTLHASEVKRVYVLGGSYVITDELLSTIRDILI